jgi:hypothetical protein
MRRFRLIKTYPYSPELGTVIIEDDLGQFVSNKVEIFEEDNVLSFPEFWQELKPIPKIGTIIKIIKTVDGCSGAEGKIGVVTGKPSYYGLFQKDNFIDGLECFNVEIGNDIWRVACHKYKVIEEPAKGRNLDFEIIEVHYLSENEDVRIEYENGNPTYRSDRKKTVNTVKLNEFTETDWKKHITISKVKRLSDGKVFSTKNVEDFNILNNPKLSYNDVWNISNNKSSDDNYIIIDKRKLKDLIKSKK